MILLLPNELKDVLLRARHEGTDCVLQGPWSTVSHVQPPQSMKLTEVLEVILLVSVSMPGKEMGDAGITSCVRVLARVRRCGGDR